MGTNLATANPRRRAWLALLGLAGFLGLTLGLTAQAQDKDKDKEKPAPAPAKPAQGEAKEGKDGKEGEFAGFRLRNVVRLGYTRPANVDDKIKNDKVVPVAFTDFKGKIIAGTVYFVVLEREVDRRRDGDRDRDLSGNDNWGTGLSDFEGRFVPGRNFDGGVSPRFDTRAKYLYLYQVVNDPGLDPQEIKPAGFDNVRGQDISSFALKLLVDPRFITSWGYFQGAGFTATAPDRNIINQVKAAADGAEQKIRLAVSSNPSILAELPHKAHRYRSPAYALGKLARTFDLGAGLLNLAGSYDAKYLTDNRAAITAAFVGNVLNTDDRLKEPNFVQVQYFSGSERFGLGDGGVDNRGVLDNRGEIDNRTEATGIFRVDWRAGQYVKLGQHSVIVGFTSDLPPVDEPIVIADPEEAMRGRQMIREILGGDSAAEPVQPVVGQAGGNEAAEGQQFISFNPRPEAAVRNAFRGQGAASGVAPAVAPGTAPTPVGGAPAAGGAMTPGGAIGSVGGLGGGGGGGIGFPGGGIGGPRSPALGGGGGFGSGGGQAQPQAAQQGAQGQQTGTLINVAATLNNQQAQQQQQGQLQGQLQGQGQNQNNHCHHGHNVVPAPASLLLGLLGVPGLFLLRRRPKTAV